MIDWPGGVLQITMNQQWQQFLETEKADFDSEAITADTELVAELSNWGVVQVTGSDAGTFLQAHFTHDISLVDDTTVQISGYCSPKGRLLALFYIVFKADSYFLLMPTDVIPSLLKRLGMFAQMARPAGKQTIGRVKRIEVELLDVSADMLLLGVAGAASTAVLQNLAGPDVALPGDGVGLAAHTTDLSIIQVAPSAESVPRWLCICIPDKLQDLWSALTTVATPVSNKRWQLEDIRAGIPAIVESTQDKVVPQMANMHLLNGISFNKGCYPGQEIVARMQYLGTLKRRTERYGYTGELVPAGTEVVTDDNSSAGIILGSAQATDGQVEVLVVIKISAINHSLHICDDNGPVLTQLALPYNTITDAEVQRE